MNSTHLDTATGAPDVRARSSNETANSPGVFARLLPGRKRCGRGRHALRFPSDGRLAVAVSRCTAGLTLVAITLAAALAGKTVFADDLQRTSDFDYNTPAPGTYTLPAVKPAADGDVLDFHGRPLRLRELTHGRVTVLSFIYTRCAAARACPYATGVLMELHRVSSEEPALANGMRLVSVSFDPETDTPERMAAYAMMAEWRSSAAPWHFLTTRSQEQLKPILNAYGQAVDRKKNRLDPTGPLNHTLRVFLIDRAGSIRNIYSADTLDPRLVLADVRTLLLESASSKPSGLSPN